VISILNTLTKAITYDCMEYNSAHAAFRNYRDDMRSYRFISLQYDRDPLTKIGTNKYHNRRYHSMD